MAQARTHRDQGSLSSLVYSFFPGPASCQAPLPTVGLPSPCTVSSLPALLPAASPASQPLCPCTSGNLPRHLPNSQPPCIPPILHFFKPPKLPALQTWSPPPTFIVLPSSPIPLFLLSCIISPSLSTPSSLFLFLPHLPSASFPPLRILSPGFSAVTDYSAKTPALRAGWERAAMSGEDPVAQGCSLLGRPGSGCLQGAPGSQSWPAGGPLGTCAGEVSAVQTPGRREVQLLPRPGRP